MWLAEQLNEPGLTETYLMAVACETRRSYVKNPARVSLDDFKLTFRRQESRPPMTREQAAAASRARWFSLMTMPVQNAPPEEE